MRTIQLTVALMSCLFTSALYAGGGSEFNKPIVINKGCVSNDGVHPEHCSGNSQGSSHKHHRPSDQTRYDKNLFNAVCPPAIAYRIETVNLKMTGQLTSLAWEKGSDGVKCSYYQGETKIARGAATILRTTFINNELKMEFTLDDGRSFVLAQTADGGTLTQVRFIEDAFHAFTGSTIAVDTLSADSELILAPLIPVPQLN